MTSLSLRVGLDRIVVLWTRIRLPASALGGALAAAAPLVLAPGSAVIGALALLLSPLLVWYAFLSATDLLRPGRPLWENATISLGLYLGIGAAFLLSLVYGAWSFQIGKPGLVYVVFLLGWPSTLMWLSFASLSLFPIS